MDLSTVEREEEDKEMNADEIEGIEENPTPKKKRKTWRFWIPRFYRKKEEQRITLVEEEEEGGPGTGPEVQGTLKQERPERELVEKEDRSSLSSNPNKFYADLHLNYNLSKLEEPQMLTAALRIVVRNIHLQGKSITFPIIEEVNKISLRANGITTDPEDLLKLIDKVFEIRKESFQMNNVYRQFVMAYGRNVFNLVEKFPACYVHTRQL